MSQVQSTKLVNHSQSMQINFYRASYKMGAEALNNAGFTLKNYSRNDAVLE